MTDKEAIAELQVYMIALSELNDDAGRVQMWLCAPNPVIGAVPRDFINSGRPEKLLRLIMWICEGGV